MQDGVYKPVQQKELVVDVQPPHNCEASQLIALCCIDANGKCKENL